MLRKFTFSLAVLPWMAGAASAEALPESIKIATEGAYAPWNFVAPDGTLRGYEIDLAKVLCERMKIKCEIVAQDWDGIIPGLSAGKYDAIMASMGVTEERKKIVAFSDPYARAPNGFLTSGSNALKDLPEAGKNYDLANAPKEAEQALADLKGKFEGKVIGLQTGSTAAPFVDAYFKGIEVLEYPTFDQLGSELLAGRIDVAVANVTVFKTIIDANKAGELAFAGPSFSGGVLGLGTINVALRQSDSSLKDAFNAAIDGINRDGTNKALTEKWFGTDISIRK